MTERNKRGKVGGNGAAWIWMWMNALGSKWLSTVTQGNMDRFSVAD